MVLLHHLLKKSDANLSLKALADILGYSAMTLTNAGEELREAGLCEVVRAGRTCHLAFTGTPRKVWQKALPNLESPVRAKHWVRQFALNNEDQLAAGMTALDRHTMINDDPVPTFALWQNDYRARLRHGEIVECMGVTEAKAMIECWSYDPKRLADGNCVDRLSLFLSLRKSGDERVQKELKAWMEKFQW
jgi:hypothetical protein